MHDEDPDRDSSLFSNPEPWEPWESTLVLGCIALGTAGLFILGWLVNRFLLP